MCVWSRVLFTVLSSLSPFGLVELNLIFSGNGDACDWRYDNQAIWSTLCNASDCAGISQSPINVALGNVKDITLPQLVFEGYDVAYDDLSIHNHPGRTAKVSFEQHCGEATLKGANLTDEFNLVQFHFHWGASNNVGSEHMFDEKSYPLELHLVHKNGAQCQGPRVAVVAIFFELGLIGSAFLDSITSQFGQIPLPSDEAPIVDRLKLTDVLPEDHNDDFLTYEGSLTTPPCNENVMWILLNKRLSVSLNQLNAFRSISYKEDKRIASTYRHVQQLNGRLVYRRNTHPLKRRYERTSHMTFLNIFVALALVFLLGACLTFAYIVMARQRQGYWRL